MLDLHSEAAPVHDWGGGGANPTSGFHREQGVRGPSPRNSFQIKYQVRQLLWFFKMKNNFLLCLFVRKNLILCLQIHNLESYFQLCFNVNWTYYLDILLNSNSLLQRNTISILQNEEKRWGYHYDHNLRMRNKHTSNNNCSFNICSIMLYYWNSN